ncbi:CdaR family transcriptional regulator [Lapidilactobacillus salsurivasis]
MELDPQIAKKIVISLKDVINHDINLFNTSGKVIASTNPDRIGTIHQGAYTAAKTHQAITIGANCAYQGSRQGTNVPVMFNDSVVAVIGITGDSAEVAPYGNIIRKMTEILILENTLQLNRFNRTANYSELAANLVQMNPNLETIKHLANLLNTDLQIERFLICAKIPTGPHQNIDLAVLGSLIQGQIQHLKQTFYAINNQHVYLFCEKIEPKQIEILIQRLQRLILSSLKTTMTFAVSTPKADYLQYWESAEECNLALDWLQFRNTTTPVEQRRALIFFSELDEGLIYLNTASKNQQLFLNKVLGNLTEMEISNYQKIFNAYLEANGSITHGAEQLFIHKNTFQNKLNQLAEITGYNPRQLADFPILYMAFLFHDFAGQARQNA